MFDFIGRQQPPPQHYIILLELVLFEESPTQLDTLLKVYLVTCHKVLFLHQNMYHKLINSALSSVNDKM